MKATTESSPIEDGRSLDHKTLEQLRLRAVGAVVRGHSPELVIDIFGFHRWCIYEWLRIYKAEGWEGLRARPVEGRPPSLDEQGKQWLKQTVLGGTPEDWGYPTTLWTRGILAELVGKHLGMQLSEATIGRYLHELGLSAQVPDWKAQEQDAQAVRRFEEEKFPSIVRLAVKIGADIYFMDESGCRANQHQGRTWGLVGHRPVVQSTGQRFGLNVLSAVSPKAGLRFKVVERSIRSQEVIAFLEALLRGSERPIIVVADRHSIHFSAAVRKFARAWRHRLKLFGLPTYSPEYNPDEGVWSELKPHGLGKQRIYDKKDFKSKLYQTMRSIQKQTDKIASFFVRTPACAMLLSTMVMSGYL
jgi:transposase